MLKLLTTTSLLFSYATFTHSSPQSSSPYPTDLKYDLSAMLSGFVLCYPAQDSPDADEAINAIQGLRARLNVPARQTNVDSYCTDLTTYESAIVAICGPPGTWMVSKDAGKMANHVYRYCRAEYDGRIRMGGVYVFGNETEPKGAMRVYQRGDSEPDLRLNF